MKKIKLILPFAALATVPAIVMPLTACNKVNYFNMTLDCITLKEKFSPYDNKFESIDKKVDVRDAIPNYINEFDDINKAIGRDIIYNAYITEQPTGQDHRIIKIKDCFFDTYEWRLSNELWVMDTRSEPGISTHISISKLKYSVNPHAQHPGDPQVRFAPLGVAGAILEDPYWTIKIEKEDGTKVEFNNKTSLTDWLDFWTNQEGDKYLCFIPRYYEGISLK